MDVGYVVEQVVRWLLYFIPDQRAALFAITVTLLLVCGYIWHRRTYSYWSSRGIKTPPVVPIFGNSLLYFLKPRKQLEKEFSEKYGKVYGYYSGSKPILVVADAQVARKICVTDFSNFQNHHKLGGLPNRYQKDFLIMQKGDKWRRMRSSMSTTFTSSKMKRMYGIINTCANDMVKYIDELITEKEKKVSQGDGNVNSDKVTVEINIQQIVRLYALDSISSCGYGISLRREKNTAQPSTPKPQEQNGTTKNSKPILDEIKLKKNITRNSMSDVIKLIFTISKFRFFANYTLPHGLLEFFNLSLLYNEGMAYLAAKLTELMVIRRESGKKHNDYLQLLMYAQVDDEFDFSDFDDAENHHLGADTERLKQEHEDLLIQLRKSQEDKVRSLVAKPNEPEKIGVTSSRELRGSMSDNEIIANAVMLLMVGTETTQAVTSDLLYILAYHPDVQERLYQELVLINKNQGKKDAEPEFDYEVLAVQKYLDAVISEAGRMQPPVIYMDRMTQEDYYLEDYKLNIDAGTPVNISFYAIQNHSDYWPEPEKFDPDRFMPENRDKIVPGSYIAFGIGPRACIGMRFGLAEMKLGIAKFILQYRVHPAPNTSYPAKSNVASFFQNQNYDLRVRISRR